MQKYLAHGLFFALLITSIPLNHAFTFEGTPKNIALLTAGSATALLIAGTLGWQCSGSKYQYQTQKDALDRQEKQVEQERQAQANFEQKRRNERIILRQVDHFIAPFLPLFEKFGHATAEQLAKNQQFHALLTELIFGNNAHIDRIGTLNQEAWQHQQNLLTIENADLSDQTTHKLHIIQWLIQRANNCARARTAQHELEKKQLSIEHERHKIAISQEQAKQERIRTGTVQKEAELRQKAAQELANTAQNIRSQLTRISNYVQEELQHQAKKHAEKMNELVAWQAHRSQEHAETREYVRAMQDEYARLERLLSIVEGTCHKLQQIIENVTHHLTRIEEGQKSQTAYLTQTFRNQLHEQTQLLAQQMQTQLSKSEQRILAQLIRSLHNLHTQLMQPTAMPQPSAPPLGPEDEIGDPAYETATYNAKK